MPSPWHGPDQVHRLKENLIQQRQQRRLQRQGSAARALHPFFENQGFQHICLPTKARVLAGQLCSGLHKLNVNNNRIFDIYYSYCNVVAILVHNERWRRALIPSATIQGTVYTLSYQTCLSISWYQIRIRHSQLQFFVGHPAPFHFTSYAWSITLLFWRYVIDVLLSNTTSHHLNPKTDVLQGLALSLHLYSVYINQLPAWLRP